MPEDNENFPFPIDGPPESPAAQPFAPEQMVRCEECLRANPPTRVNCLYCGAVLPLDESTVKLQKPALRPLEKWERGYNNILLPPAANPAAQLNEAQLAEAADLLRLTTEELSRILASAMPLPLARAATHDEASLVQRRLGAVGINTMIASDAELGLDESAPFRVRAIEIDDSGIHAFQSPEALPVQIPWTDLVLLVVGRLIVKRVELKEQKEIARKSLFWMQASFSRMSPCLSCTRETNLCLIASRRIVSISRAWETGKVFLQVRTFSNYSISFMNMLPTRSVTSLTIRREKSSNPCGLPSSKPNLAVGGASVPGNTASAASSR